MSPYGDLWVRIPPSPQNNERSEYILRERSEPTAWLAVGFERRSIKFSAENFARRWPARTERRRGERRGRIPPSPPSPAIAGFGGHSPQKNATAGLARRS